MSLWRPVGIYQRKDSRFWWLLLERKGRKGIREPTKIWARPSSAAIAEENRALAERAYQRRMSDLEQGRIANALVINGRRDRSDARGWTYVYFVKAVDSDSVKIGRATDVSKRIRALQIGHDSKLELLALVPAHFGLERALHRRFRHQHRRGEWYAYDGELRSFVEAVISGRHPMALLADESVITY